jgi:L-ascorbate metabolism protein UlaG (beta-lactamase superfamily)
MKLILWTVLAAVPALSADKFSATGGDIEITPIFHASVRVEHAGKVIYVDPWRQGDFSNARPADMILVTGAESDHLDVDTIRKIRKQDTVIVIPAACKSAIPDGIVLANGESQTIMGARVEAIAAYDLIPGDPFHPKGRGNGYIITLGGTRLYFGGVTECVPEVQALKNIDVAFLSINLPHGRMTPAAAANCVKTFQPKNVYPYHYRDGNVEEFREALRGEPVQVHLTNWYPVSVK